MFSGFNKFSGQRDCPFAAFRCWKFATSNPCLLLLLLTSCATPRSIPEWSLELDAGPYHRENGIVEITLPTGLESGAPLALKNPATGRLLPLQRRTGASAVFVLDEPLAAGQKRTYQLVKPGKKQAETVKATDKNGVLTIAAGNKNVLNYQMDTRYPPPGNPDYYRRSGFIHPLYSPGGQVITDGFPEDHMHQHAIFFAYTNTTYRDSFTDFWNQQLEKAGVEFVELREKQSGPVFAGFTARHRHSSRQFGPVLEEEWKVEVFELTRLRRTAGEENRDSESGRVGEGATSGKGAAGDFYVLDLQSTQKITGADTLFINQYHYGGLGIRGSAEWNMADSLRFSNPMQILTSEGLRDRVAANHSRPRWTAIYGQIDGQTAGLAVLDHPDNFRHPQPIRMHPEMPYFSLSPMVLGAYPLVSGETYRMKYRIVAFQGEPDPKRLEALWRDYAVPPTYRVEKSE